MIIIIHGTGVSRFQLPPPRLVNYLELQYDACCIVHVDNRRNNVPNVIVSERVLVRVRLCERVLVRVRLCEHVVVRVLVRVLGRLLVRVRLRERVREKMP